MTRRLTSCYRNSSTAYRSTTRSESTQFLLLHLVCDAVCHLFSSWFSTGWTSRCSCSICINAFNHICVCLCAETTWLHLWGQCVWGEAGGGHGTETLSGNHRGDEEDEGQRHPAVLCSSSCRRTYWQQLSFTLFLLNGTKTQLNRAPQTGRVMMTLMSMMLIKIFITITVLTSLEVLLCLSAINTF